ncbi:MAG: LysR family transcriptional regulator [Verrucomicrobia bacterium]|nr:LysR family transcriptional regulator [Verrucomicrobiota bacterium]MDA1005961.1 LysR family transcriptional regulator [Verrucomicrobiota bacterium]
MLGCIDFVNIHHLELFYYVAKYEGITAAVRKMPYGIQQPAVSGQILHLERELGVKLFNRRPFALTPAGEELYDYLYPFFSQLSEVEARLKGEESRHLRIAASAAVLRNHLPDVLVEMREAEPNLRLTLREVEPADMHAMLGNQQVDIGVSLIYGRYTDALQTRELLRLPFVLLVPEIWGVTKFSEVVEDDEFGKGKVAKYPLVGLPPHEVLSKIFQEALDERDIVWAPSVEVDSLEIVEEYVARGFGAGVSIQIPGRENLPGVRPVALRGFPPAVVGALYQGTLKPLAKEFLNLASKRAKQLGKKR